MAQETLNRIRETELAAKQQVLDAKASAEDMLEQARQEVTQYKEELLSGARADAKRALEEVQAGTQKALDAAQVRAGTVVEQFSKNLEDREDQAVRMVIDHMI